MKVYYFAIAAFLLIAFALLSEAQTPSPHTKKIKERHHKPKPRGRTFDDDANVSEAKPDHEENHENHAEEDMEMGRSFRSQGRRRFTSRKNQNALPFHCTFVGSIGIKNKCKNYLMCLRKGVNGSPTKCGGLKFFDQITRRCVKKIDARCISKEVCPTNSTRYPDDAGDTTAFLECQDGVPHPKHCPVNTHFNNDTLRCEGEVMGRAFPQADHNYDYRDDDPGDEEEDLATTENIKHIKKSKKIKSGDANATSTSSTKNVTKKPTEKAEKKKKSSSTTTTTSTTTSKPKKDKKKKNKAPV